MIVRLVTADDAAAIAAIYAPYVADSAISFEAEPPNVEEMRSRIAAGRDLYPWFVAEEDGLLIGYAYASPFRARHAYRFTVEMTVYVRGGSHGRGVGGALYDALLPVLLRQGFTQAIAALTLPNEASVKLHERYGFTRAGAYENVGHKFGEWRSVGLWQRALAPLSETPSEPAPFAGFYRP